MLKNNPTKILDNETLMRLAPSVFAEVPASKCSSQYKMIPTIAVVNSLRSEGWMPVMAGEQRVRNQDRQGFQKHIMRFRRDLSITTEQVPELVLTNSHDGTNAYTLHAGFFRFVCSNGLIVCDSTFQKISIIHKGFEPIKVIEASYQVLNEMPKLIDKIGSMKSIELNRQEQEIFAESALGLRYDEDNKAPIEPTRLLHAWRTADQSNDLWTTFNRVQENLIQGGQRGRTANGGRSSTRAVKGIDSNLKLNKALWSLAEKMQELKIVKGNDLTKTCIGKHLIDPSEFELESAIECAMRDGFERIYVYGGAK